MPVAVGTGREPVGAKAAEDRRIDGVLGILRGVEQFTRSNRLITNLTLTLDIFHASALSS